MNYQEFKDYLIDFLWKKGDTQVIANLDNLIRLAEQELRRTFMAEYRENSAVLPVTTLDVTPPPDYHSMRSVSIDDPRYNEFTSVKPQQIYIKRQQMSGAYWWPHYALLNRKILLVGPTNLTPPANLIIDYYERIPEFRVTNDSWVEREFLDVYTYCILKHSAPFLREDERVPLWKSMFTDALTSANEDFAFNQQRGMPNSPPLPYQSSVRRRRLV